MYKELKLHECKAIERSKVQQAKNLNFRKKKFALNLNAYTQFYVEIAMSIESIIIFDSISNEKTCQILNV